MTNKLNKRENHITSDITKGNILHYIICSFIEYNKN